MYTSDTFGIFPPTPAHSPTTSRDLEFYKVTSGTPQKIDMEFELDLAPVEEKYIPEYKIIVIVEKAVGNIAPNLVRRQLVRQGIRSNRLTIEQYPDFLKSLEQATTFLCAKPVRAKMMRELAKLGDKYAS